MDLVKPLGMNGRPNMVNFVITMYFLVCCVERFIPLPTSSNHRVLIQKYIQQDIADLEGCPLLRLTSM